MTGARSSCRTGDPDTVVLETIGLDWSGQAGPRLFGLAFDLLQRTGVGLVHGAFPLETIQFKPEPVDVPFVPDEWVGATFRLVNAAIVAFKNRGRFFLG